MPATHPLNWKDSKASGCGQVHRDNKWTHNTMSRSQEDGRTLVTEPVMHRRSQTQLLPHVPLAKGSAGLGTGLPSAIYTHAASSVGTLCSVGSDSQVCVCSFHFAAEVRSPMNTGVSPALPACLLHPTFPPQVLCSPDSLGPCWWSDTGASESQRGDWLPSWNCWWREGLMLVESGWLQAWARPENRGHFPGEDSHNHCGPCVMITSRSSTRLADTHVRLTCYLQHMKLCPATRHV